jgi:hypothetical protein
MIEVVLDGRLAAPGDEDELLDSGRACLFDSILDQGLIDHGQHLLGQGLGRREKSGAEAAHGKDRLAQRALSCWRWHRIS